LNEKLKFGKFRKGEDNFAERAEVVLLGKRLNTMPHFYVKLAKKAIETYIKKGEVISLSKDFPQEFLTQKAGVFVTIEKNLRGLPRSEPTCPVGSRSDSYGEVLLRGCIGTYLPTRENIAEEIIHNAIAAATEDYRFEPIKMEELPDLTYTVYILSQPELVKDIKELDPKKYGIIVKTSHFASKTGLLLPDLEGVDTIEQQLSIACQKGGIDPIKEKILIYRFTATKYK